MSQDGMEGMVLKSSDPDGFGGELNWTNPKTGIRHQLRVVMNFTWLFSQDKSKLKKWDAEIDGQPAGEFDGPLDDVFEELKKKVQST